MISYKLKTAPAVEPVTKDDAKAYMRVESAVTAEDTLITALCVSARRQAEEYLGRALITQTWEMFLDGIGCSLSPELIDAIEEATNSEFIPAAYRAIVVPRPPLQSITSIKYYDVDDVEATWASSNYRLDTYSEPGRILLTAAGAWPENLRAQQSILVTFVAGYGAAATDVPDDIKTAIKQMVAHWYENRESQEMPPEAKITLAPYRVIQI
ncbi:MAG: head-tail connector protein [Methanomassiliicoccales archaeon]